jgi:hypothetical protein
MLLAYVTILPILIVANVLVVALLVAWAVVAKARTRRAARVATVVVTTASVMFWGAMMLFTGVKRDVGFNMTWEYGEPFAACPGTPHVILRFRDYPNHAIGIHSRDLGDYLETLPDHNVHVIIEVTRDFWWTRGIHEVQVGELRQWDTCDGYYSVTGEAEPSPFR